MNQPPNHRKRVVVIGGGITGLAAAHRLTELDPTLEIVLLESSSRLGGVIETERREHFLIERSADSFITSVPWAVDLCRRIGFDSQLNETAPRDRNAMVVFRGHLQRVPEGFLLMAPARLWPMLSTPILSPLGKLRLLGEYFVRRRKAGGDESLASFARRRLGREVFERIVQPLVGGIYTADPERLSIEATLPRFVDMERRFGGLIRGARRAARTAHDHSTSSESGARYGLFVTPRGGLSSLVTAIAEKLPAGSVRLGAAVERIVPAEGQRWQVVLAGRDGETIPCDALVVATPAPAAARLVKPLDPNLAHDLAAIEYAGTSIVTVAYRRGQISHPLDSFGFVVPAGENRKILAASFSSVKFPDRAPEGTVLIRVFLGGACQGELADLGDAELRKVVEHELAELIGAKGAPLLVDIARWPRSMPQYHVGHCQRVERIEVLVANWPTLALAGSAYRGVGIPHCIHSGELAAARVVAALGVDK